MGQRLISVADAPRWAPANFRELPARVVIKDGEGLFETWHGSGVATALACGACENVAGNLKIYNNWGFSYPNGHSWDDVELVCGACGKFTVINEFQEG